MSLMHDQIHCNAVCPHVFDAESCFTQPLKDTLLNDI